MKHTMVRQLFISRIMQKLKSLLERRNEIRFLLVMVLLSNMSFLRAQYIDWGNGYGTKYDRWTINDDYTSHWSYLRLQTGQEKYDNGQAWNMVNQGDLWWGFTEDDNPDNKGTRRMTLTQDGNLGIGVAEPERKLEVNGDILLSNSTGQKQIFMWHAHDNNWRIGMNENPGFTRSMATSQVQFLTYASEANQGFAVGVNGGESSFEIQGSDHAAFFRGNVGIGTTDLNKPLTIRGRGENSVLMGFQNSSGDNKYHWNLKDDGLNLAETDVANYRLFIGDGGNIGIGTSTPSEKLEVAGDIKSTGDIEADSIFADHIIADRVVLNVGTFPDYVFANDYELMPLETLETYIQTHKHLPKMPTEAEVVEKGADLGKINRLLVEKVEELTLHLIEVNKELKALKRIVNKKEKQDNKR